MKTVSISGSTRANVGKKDAQDLRRAGMVPCVLYGGQSQIHFSAPILELEKLVFTPDAHIVELNLGGKTYKSVLQEAQYHKITDALIHIDFLEIIANKPITVKLPIKIEGNSIGVKAGGKLEKKMRFLKVRGMADQMPENIVVNIDKLDMSQVIRVKEIQAEGVQLLDPANNSVVGVKMTRAAVQAAAAETGKKGKKK